MPATVLSETARRRHANQRIHALTGNQYFESIPLADLKAILAEQAFQTEPLDGIYCGAQGRIAPAQVGERTWITLSWYRMVSGRYEITCYLS
jgi:hypothetical protein